LPRKKGGRVWTDCQVLLFAAGARGVSGPGGWNGGIRATQLGIRLFRFVW